jgi:hypothetical protein
MIRWFYVLSLLGLLILFPTTAKADEAPEPGPEDGGLRLRLVVKPRADAKEGYDVRLEVLNVSDRPVTLRAGWRNDNEMGDLKGYLEAATSVECVPAVAPWIGGVQAPHRTLPQPEHVLKAGENLPVAWQTEGRRLKNRVTDPIEVQNPTFPLPGLYSVHSVVDVVTDERTVRLRSNEQLVVVGGSRSMPKSTFGRLWHVDPEGKTAILGLGSLHKITAGDQFEIGHAKGGHWKLTITRVDLRASYGTVEVLPSLNPRLGSTMPQALMDANLIKEK